MDRFLSMGYIVLLLLIVGYILIWTLLYWNRNPSSIVTTLSPSTVTHSYLGRRGDMGNQIFQLACVIATAKRSKSNVAFPTSISMLPIIDLFDLTMFEWKDIVPDAVFHEYDNYEPIVIPADGRNYDIRGYRQAYTYFEDYADDIRNIFKPKDELLNSVLAVVPPQYIAVHIRRGDTIKFIHKVPLLREFRRCQLEYYKEGVRKIREIYPEIPVLVCTDSPKLATPMLSDIDPDAKLAPIVKGISDKLSDFCTLYLASAVIMSNSTFSFWAAYLRNNRPVICPSPWWDPIGFIGTAMGLDGPYLHYPEWYLMNPDTGELVREPNSEIGNKPDCNSDTLNLYRLTRGLLL